MDVGREIRRLREARGWSQAKLAGDTGMGVSGISQIETGTRNPSAVSLAKIAGALGVEVGDLFPKAQAPLPDFEDERRAATRTEPLKVLMATGIRAWELAPLLDEVAATVQGELEKEVQAVERAEESGLPQERHPEYHKIAHEIAGRHDPEVLATALVVLMREDSQWGQMPELRRRLDDAYHGSQSATEPVAKQAQDAG